MARATYPGPGDRLAAYEAVVSRLDGVERKGAANPYTSLNGWMTSFIDAEGAVSLRLAPDDRAAFADAHPTRTPVQYGKEMVEFVIVPAELVDDLDAVVPWFERSLAWIATRKPKKTRR